MPERPAGITLIAVLSMLGGTLGLCGGCVLLGFGSIIGPLGALFGGGQVGGQAFASGLSWTIGALLSLVAAFGLWQMLFWGWWLGIIGTGWSLMSALWGLTQGGSWCLSLPAMLIPGVILLYLLTPHVRQSFGRP